MELDHEKFQGAKELAEIHQKISAGTAALAQLKVDEGAYLDEREEKLVARLQQALVDSQDLITAIGENHSALIGYKNELGDFLGKVLSLIQGISDCREIIDKAATSLEERINSHEIEVAAFKEKTRKINLKIEADLNELSAWRDKLGAEQRLFDDRKEMLERNFNRVKN